MDELSGRVVAVKVLSDRLEDEQAEERFARETRILANIESPHVVGYVGHGRAPNGSPFVAVDWLEGEDLAQRQRRRPLSGKEVVDVIEQTAAGLAEIHALGVIHRDVKPSNLFLTKADDGALHVTVIDLGVARVKTEPGLTQHGTMIGTPSYMPPEQILGMPLTPRSDVFSLGVVLFELITSHKPYAGDDVLTVVAKIALQDPPRLRDHLPSIAADVDAIVARAMAKDPAERFASVTALGEALASASSFRTAREPKNADDVKTEIVTSSSLVEGITITATERRVVTAVFAQVPQVGDAKAFNLAFERISRQHGGIPHTLLALAHVSVFGGALSTGDEAQRAARAALLISREPSAAEISIATGRGLEALSGDAIERAAKASLGAPERRIRVDEPTARLLGEAFEVSREAADIRLIGERALGRSVRTLLGRATPCVGRARELAQLEALFDEVEREPVARAAIVVAPAGAGKSRVRHEVEQKLYQRETPPVVLIGRGSALAEGAAFGLLGSAIRGFARLREGEPVESQREKLGLTIPEVERASLLPLISRIAGVGEDAARPGEDGALVSDRLRDAFERWLAHICAERSVALILEDVQWADAPSITLVDGALRNLAERPLFVLALARPEVDRRFPNLWEARGPQTFRLAKLTRKSSAALVAHVAGAALDDTSIESILERADGNAFYLEELIRAAVEGAGRGEAGRGALELPDTVLGMVQARLDALGPEGKRLLKAASIFGEAAWPSAIAGVLGGAENLEAVEDALKTLVDREVLERRVDSRFSGENEFVFRHALLREAAYELLLDEDRARAHLRAGAWLEAHGESESFVLARHFELGGANDRALPHYRRAAEQALYGSDFAAVIECSDKAIACGASGELLGNVQLVVAEARRWRGDLSSALVAAEEARRLFARGSVPWFSAMRELVAAHGRLGNKAAIAPIAEDVRATRAFDGAAGAQIAALVPAAVHLLYIGDSSAAEALARHIEDLATAAVTLDPRARARLHQLRAMLATNRDAHEEGITEQLAALEQFDHASDKRAAALVRSNLAFLLLQLGDLERAAAILREALAVATRLGLGTIRPLVLQNLGIALAWSGRHEEALQAQSEAAAAFRAQRDPRLEGASRVHLALLHLDLGDLASVERETRLVIDSGVETIEVGARAALARAHLAGNRPNEALEEARQSIAILDRVKTVEEFEVLARLTLAEALAATNHRAEALEALAIARARIDARLEKVSDATLRRSFVERIPEHARVFALSSTL